MWDVNKPVFSIYIVSLEDFYSPEDIKGEGSLHIKPHNRCKRPSGVSANLKEPRNTHKGWLDWDTNPGASGNRGSCSIHSAQGPGPLVSGQACWWADMQLFVCYIEIFTTICSTALQWWTVHSWELELIARVAANWKTTAVQGHFRCFNDLSINTCNNSLNASWCPLMNKVEQQVTTWRRLFQLLQETNRRFWVISRGLTLCFSVGTWEDTTKHSVKFLSLKTIFIQRIVK